MWSRKLTVEEKDNRIYSVKEKEEKYLMSEKFPKKLVEVRHRLGVHNVFNKSKIEASSLHQAADELIKICVALSTK